MRLSGLSCALACAASLLIACGGSEGAKKPLGVIPDVQTSAEPEWLPFAVRAGAAFPMDAREKHLGELRTIPVEGDVERVGWAPDGRSLVVRAATGNEERDLAVDLGSGAIAPASSDAARACYPPLSGAVSSTDQTRVAATGETHAGLLTVGSLSASDAHARNVVPVGPPTSRSPDFLAGAARLAFASDVDDPAFQIYVADLDAPRADGSMPPRARVTYADGGSDAPAFSPDGKHLAFVSRRKDHRASAPRQLFVARWLEDR